MASKEQRASIFLREHIRHVRSHNHEESSWQARLLRFLHSNAVQWGLLVLLILDVFGIFVGLFLDSEFPSCHYVVRDATCGNEEVAQCDQEGKYPGVEAVSTILESISLVILTSFMTENCLLLVALGFRTYFSHALYALDFFVVSISLLFEVSTWFIDDNILADLVQIIIVTRLWRFISLCYDLWSMQHEHDEEAIERFKERIAQLESLLEKNHVIVPPSSSCLKSTEGEAALPPQGDDNYHTIS